MNWPAGNYAADRETLRRKLQHLRQHLRQQIDSLEQDRLVTVGLLGPRESGKTSLLISWYLSRTADNGAVSLKASPDTLPYLRKSWEYLRTHGNAQANENRTPEQLNFVLTLRGGQGEESWPIRTIDYPGEYTQPTDSEGKKKDAARTREFFQDCDVVVCLADCRNQSLEMIDALDTLLFEARKPCLLVLSKWDQTGELPAPPLSRQAQTEECAERLRQLAEDNPRLAELMRKLRAEQAERRLVVVPVSALGRDLSDLPLPLDPADVQSWNVHEPLVRAVQQKRAALQKLRGEYAAARRELQELEQREAQRLAQVEAERARQAAARKEREEKRARKAKAELRDRYQDISAAVQRGLTAGPLEMPFQPYADWTGELTQVLRLADDQHNEEISRGCRQWLARISSRHQTMITSVALLLMGSVASLMVYLVKF